MKFYVLTIGYVNQEFFRAKENMIARAKEVYEQWKASNYYNVADCGKTFEEFLGDEILYYTEEHMED